MRDRTQVAALAALSELSARIGCDPRLVQGPGGNTSIKLDDELWVKASGFWLADALMDDIFTSIPLAPIATALERDSSGEHVDATIKELAAGKPLRPSIETSLHALMPHKVVVHVHAVDLLAELVRPDGEQRVADRLDGLSWCWVPYYRPGPPLTIGVRARLAHRGRVDILMLANHGAFLGADTVAGAEALLTDLSTRFEPDDRLALAAESCGDAVTLNPALAALGYRAVRHARAHSLATNAAAFDLLQRGVYYPDQAVFLGPAIAVVTAGGNLETAIAAWEGRYGRAPSVVAIQDEGVFVAAQSSRAVDAQLLGHAHLLARLDPRDQVATLGEADVAALLNWDAEVYRQSLAKRSS